MCLPGRRLALPQDLEPLAAALGMAARALEGFPSAGEVSRLSPQLGELEKGRESRRLLRPRPIEKLIDLDRARRLSIESQESRRPQEEPRRKRSNPLSQDFPDEPAGQNPLVRRNVE